MDFVLRISESLRKGKEREKIASELLIKCRRAIAISVRTIIYFNAYINDPMIS